MKRAPNGGVPVAASQFGALVEGEDEAERPGADARVFLAALRQHGLRVVDVPRPQPHAVPNQEPDQACTPMSHPIN